MLENSREYENKEFCADEHRLQHDHTANIEAVVEAVKRAILLGLTPNERAEFVKGALEQELRAGITIPAFVENSVKEGYDRHLVYLSSDRSFSVMLMSWSPEHQSPIHNHKGHWGVECVLKGQLEITDYIELDGSSSDEKNLQQSEKFISSVGKPVIISPENNLHLVKNSAINERTISLHIYGGLIDSCDIYLPNDNGTFERRAVRCDFDSMPEHFQSSH